MKESLLGRKCEHEVTRGKKIRVGKDTVKFGSGCTGRWGHFLPNDGFSGVIPLHIFSLGC